MSEIVNIKNWAVITTVHSRKTFGVPYDSKEEVLAKMGRGEVIRLDSSFEFTADFMLGKDQNGNQAMSRMPMCFTRDFLTTPDTPVYVVAQEIYFLEDLASGDQAVYLSFIQSAMQMAIQHRMKASGLVMASNGVQRGG